MSEWVFYLLFSNLGFSVSALLHSWVFMPAPDAEELNWVGKLRVLSVYVFIVLVNVVAITLGLVAG